MENDGVHDLGEFGKLYENLLFNADKSLISNHFGEPGIGKFKNYLSVIREVRNACAHGNVIVGLSLTNSVEAKSKACPSLPVGTQNTFNGAIRVIDYMLRKISVNRANDLWNDLFRATTLLYAKAPSLQALIEKKTGIVLPSIGNK